jgi:ribosomal protein S12 methylthiotransferase accessory factor
VWSLTGERHRLLPTQFLYFAHPGPPEEAFSFADSNGNAAGNTRVEACLQGAFELVERDAVGIWWYNRLSMPAVDLGSIRRTRTRQVLRYYEDTGRPVHILDLTLDLGVPTYAAVSRARQGPEEILLGFGAHFEAEVAVARAITEVGQSLAVLRGYRSSGAPPRSALARWFDEGTLASHPYLAPTEGERRPLPARSTQKDSPADQLGRILDIVRDRGLDMLVLDQTRPDLRIPVVKSIIPGLRHFWRRSAPGRLYDVPVSLGLRDQPIREEELNPLPMFL